MNNIAIIAVAYNRVNSLSRLLNSLEKAWYGNERPTLIISIDKSKSDLVERYADDYVWPHGDKIIKKHEKNMGLRSHMMSLGQWFKKYDTLVVLEDDLVVSPAFYNYTRQASDKYFNNPKIAGISLYSFSTNYISLTPFSPMINEYDGYLMNCAMSWGEIWMKNQWIEFYKWYLGHQEFSDEPHLPRCLHTWSKSWLKYHTKYCIENDKYFLYPYVALSSNFSDPGTHNENAQYSTFQLVLQQGIKTYSFPDDESQAVCYDGFFENKALYQVLGLTEKDCCIDLYSTKCNRMRCKYWLTTDIVNLPIVKSFGIVYKPMEQNVIQQIAGSGIFLYECSKQSYSIKHNSNVLLYRYNIDNLASFLRSYGLVNIVKMYLKKLKTKICF